MWVNEGGALPAALHLIRQVWHRALVIKGIPQLINNHPGCDYVSAGGIAAHHCYID